MNKWRARRRDQFEHVLIQMGASRIRLGLVTRRLELARDRGWYPDLMEPALEETQAAHAAMESASQVLKQIQREELPAGK